MNFFLKLQYHFALFSYRFSNFLLSSLQFFLFGFKKIKNPKTILIFRGNAQYLGDTICVLPTFRFLRKTFPKARLILMTNKVKGHPFMNDALQRNALVDDFLIYDPTFIRKFSYWKNLLKEIKKQSIDLAIFLAPTNATIPLFVRNMLFFKLANCKNVWGFRMEINRVFAKAQRIFKAFDPEPVRMLKLVMELVGRNDWENELIWEIPSVPFPRLNEAFHPLVAVHPSANLPVKKWPLDRYVAVCRFLQEEYGAFLVFIGGSNVLEDVKFLEDRLKKPFLNLVGQTNYLETAEVLRRCDFLLSNDSGPLHLASAVGTPVVGIYSSREYPGIWHPIGNVHEILRKDVPCQICGLKECPILICIHGIGVEEVMAACARVLQKKGYQPIHAPLNKDKI
jgi:heptosyltransferase-2